MDLWRRLTLGHDCKPSDIILDYDEEKEITDILLFHKIVKAENDILYLDNGVELEILPNIGGCCGDGKYNIKSINGCDNAITNVTFEKGVSESGERDEDEELLKSYKIFVYAEDKRIKIVEVDGSDGNGWYGTGYTIRVKLKND